MTDNTNPHAIPQDASVIQIPMRSGGTLIIDAVDADLLAHNWNSFCPSPSTGVYYARAHYKHGRRNYEQLYIHRVIGARIAGHELARNEYVDHKNKNGLDNRRENLRVCSASENAANRKANVEHRSSQYKGVHLFRGNKWRARIKNRHLGTFDTEEDAYAAYCEAAKSEFGEFFCDGTQSQPETETIVPKSTSRVAQTTKGAIYQVAGQWSGHVIRMGKRIELGMFATEEEAHAAFIAAQSIYPPTSQPSDNLVQ